MNVLPNMYKTIGVTIIILFLGLGGWWYLNRPKTTDETANWKAYKNPVTGLEFRYPSDWPDPVSPPDGAPFNFPENEMKYGNDFFVALVDDAYIEFGFTGDNTSPSLTLSQKRNIFCNDNCEDGASKTGIPYLIMNLETERKGQQVFVDIGQIINSYEVKFNLGSPEYYKKHKTKFELLLFSLKATADRQTVLRDETANWKVYENKKYEFSLKYPPQFEIKGGPDGYAIFSLHSANKQSDGLTALFSLKAYVKKTKFQIANDYYYDIENNYISTILKDISGNPTIDDYKDRYSFLRKTLPDGRQILIHKRDFGGIIGNIDQAFVFLKPGLTVEFYSEDDNDILDQIYSSLILMK